MAARYSSVHIVINPASGKNQPILNTINDVMKHYGVKWDATITHKRGDATAQAREAIARGADLVAGYGGDGTQHEIANAVIGTGVPMAVLPGGTGNGFCTEIGVSHDLREALITIATSAKVRQIDAVRMGSEYFIQRLYTGTEPEQQTSRELKDRYGILAYAFSLKEQTSAAVRANYRLTIDRQVFDRQGIKCYVVNSARTGTGITIDRPARVDDGLLDVFLLDWTSVASVTEALKRLIVSNQEGSGLYSWRGSEVTIEATPDRPVWADGEHLGSTPVTAVVIPGALSVIAP
ncbi:MAG: NAD(+)/NADH kinase [Anaerolineae bacterium]|nr:NAD(+)/NADH kinase [Anaerolineae bacterium]